MRVRWSDCDAQGIAYNAAYLTWTEVSLAEYCRNLDFKLYKLAEVNHFDTVMVKLTMEYKAPARIDDLLEIYVRVTSMGNSSIIMDFEMYREGDDVLLTRAEGIYANYDNREQTARPIPEEVRCLFSSFEETGRRVPLEELPALARASAT